MDKSIKAAVDAGMDRYGDGDPASVAIRAAIEAYRDAEIADLRAKLEAAEQRAELHSSAWRALGHMLGRFPELSKEIIDAARGGERG